MATAADQSMPALLPVPTAAARRAVLLCIVLLALSSLQGRTAGAASGNDGTKGSEPIGRANLGFRSPQLSDFFFEVVVICMLVVYIFNYIRGKGTNEKLARSWVASQSSIVAQNFAHVGDNDGHLIVRDGATHYVLYASGRRYCLYMFVKIKILNSHPLVSFVTLQLLPRQDLFRMLYHVFAGSRDKLTIEVALDHDATDNFVFAVLPRKKAIILKKSRWDIEHFARQYPAEGLPESHVCLSEGPELVEVISNGRLASSIRASGNQFEELIISDQPTEKPTVKAPPQKTLILTYYLSLSGVDSSDLLRTAIDLIDIVAENAKLRPETRAKGRKTRDEARKDLEKEEMRDRQATLQQQKAEQRRKELDKVSRMTPDQQRKWEEKERKSALKKQLKQRMKLAK